MRTDDARRALDDAYPYTLRGRFRIWLASKILGDRLWRWFIRHSPMASLARVWDNEEDERWNDEHDGNT